jgi:purine-nucleoside phosphorylase
MIESAPISSKEVLESIKFFNHIANFRPKIALILGSGLGNLVDKIDSIATINYSEIPNFPVSSVQGHAGRLNLGYFSKDTRHTIPLLVFQGRVHFYEFGSIDKVFFPITFSHQLGIKKMIITNAAGGINSNFNAGDLMLIQDILNLSFVHSPIVNSDSKLPEIKCLNYFDEEMTQIARKSALEIKLSLHQGTYCWFKGPSYETPAEIKMLKRFGVDAVGMSTVPEIFIAHSLGIKILAISLISNLAAGISSEKLSHSDVTKTGIKITERFSELIEQLVISLK